MKKGFVYKRKDKWCVAIPNIDYKRGYQRLSMGFSKKSQANEYLDKRKYQIKDIQAKGVGEGNIAYLEAFKEVLQYVSDNLSKETHKSYKGIVKDFYIFMQQKHPVIQWLYELKPKIFDEYKSWLRDTGYKDQSVRQFHKSETINNHIKVFKALFNKLIKWEHIEANPMDKVELVSVNDTKPIVTLDTPEKLKLFFERCKKIKPEYYPHYFCSAMLGLRFGEMCSLKWDNVVFEHRVIRIVGDGNFTPKGRSRKDKKPKERIIPVNSDVEGVLKQLPRKSKYVFLKKGKPIGRKDKSFRRWIIAIVKGTEFEGMTRFHELRHTTGDILGQKHSIYDIKEFLGHSDIRTTQRYVRVSDARKREMAGTLGDFKNTTHFTTQNK